MPDAELQAADLALLDSLTGLWNRRALLAALRQHLPNGRGALILLDLDGFKPVIERVGSENADRILLDVAGRLLGVLERDPLLYRYGGDTFALLMPDADRERGAEMAEKLRTAISKEPFRIFERLGPTPASIPVVASGAVAAFPIDARSPASLIEAVERALFVAKRTGRDRVAVAGRLDPAALAEIGIFRGLPCPVFVGRAPEQARLRQIASQAREVGPRIALVTGPPGIGKSRLLQEVCRWARAERFVVMAGICAEPHSGSPYATLIEQIEQLIAVDRVQAMQALEHLTPLHRAALASLSRDIPPPPTPPPPDSGVSEGKTLFEALGALLDELSHVGALLLAADEIEYADDASLEVYGAALARRLPLLLAATADREGAEFERTAAGQFFRDHETAVTRLQLGSLSPEDSRQALSSILPDADVAPDAVENLVVTSGGNPLYMEETVRALLLKGKLKLAQGRWTLPPLTPADLPKDVDDAIRTVSASLPAGANWLLTRAAVIGTRVDAEFLQEVLGQREAEALDFIDEARRARLLLPAEGQEEVLAFPASHTRRIRLNESDATERKVIHGRVGVVQEARHGGDVSHLADELAYHYGRAGQESRAKHFDAIARKRAAVIQPPRAKGTRRTRLEPMTEALSPAATEHALALMRHFAAIVKIRRLYPQWSQVGAQFLSQLRQSLEALQGAAPGVTIASSPMGPMINGQGTIAVVATDFIVLLDDRLVESMTILRTFAPDRLEKLVDEFVAPFDRMRVAPDHWDRFLTREGLEGIDVVQKAYEAQRTKVRSAARHGDTPVPAEHLGAVRDALRYLKAGVDNLRLYPPGHPLVEESQLQACKTIVELVAKVPAVTIGTADGELVLNQMPADKKFFGEAGSWIAREVEQREFKTISIWQGLVEDEVRALVSCLSMPAKDLEEEEVRDSLLSQFKHVAVASLTYERATSGAPEAERLHPPPKPIRAELRARAHLARPYDKFLTVELEHEFHVLVEALTYGAGRPLAEQMCDRLGDHFHDAALAHRRQAYRLLEHALAYASPSTRQLEVSRSAPPLRTRLAEDAGPLHFHAAASLLPIWIPAAVTAGCLKELSEVVARTLRKRADSSDTPPDIRRMCETAIVQILESRAFERVAAAVRRPQETERRAAIDILLAIGGPARRELIVGLVEDPDRESRRSVAALLAPSVDALAAELGSVLKSDTPVEKLLRMLETVDLFPTPSLAVPLASLLDHPEAKVRREVLKAARGGPRSVALTIVRRLLASQVPDDRNAGFDLAGAMKLTEVSVEIGRILEETKEEAELVRCCKYFAQAPNLAVVPLLIEIAQTRPRLFGLVKGYSAQTRAEAVIALAAQRTPQAEEAVKDAITDPEVKALAKL